MVYYYSEQEGRYRYLVNFTPCNNSKGPAAKNIILTDELFNEVGPGETIEAEVTEVKQVRQTLTRIVQGIKKGEGRLPFTTVGSNGTYSYGYPEEYKELVIRFQRTDDIGWGAVLAREQFTNSFEATLRQKLTGKRLRLVRRKDEWHFQDSGVLKVYDSNPSLALDNRQPHPD
ncbi:MAG TPA: hypothetical protein VFE53_18315 [Mucilaginibacter sp.]|jgi:hypothetical protein|nr:hypothetical protein [Mucilaginibacter sp.]